MAEYIEREALVHHFMTTRQYLTKDLVMDAAYEVSKFPAADVAPVVHCKNCVYDKDCFIQKSLSIANIDNPYCCLGKRKARMDGE